MLQQRGEELYGEAQSDIEAYLRLVWPCELTAVDPVTVEEEKSLILWIDVERACAAVQRRTDPPGALMPLGGSEEQCDWTAAWRIICACGSDVHEVSVGRQESAPPWVLIGTRCVECGVLELQVDWNLLERRKGR